jgi:hypothetical protein
VHFSEVELFGSPEFQFLYCEVDWSAHTNVAAVACVAVLVSPMKTGSWKPAGNSVVTKVSSSDEPMEARWPPRLTQYASASLQVIPEGCKTNLKHFEYDPAL